MDRYSLGEVRWEGPEQLKDWAGIKLWKWWGTMPWVLPGDVTYVGLDAGRFAGMAWLNGGMAILFHMEFPKMAFWEMGFLAHNFLQSVFRENGALTNTVIEGAAYGSQFGEANLAYIRMGMALALREFGAVDVVPPASIRAKVCGHRDNTLKSIFKVGPHARLAHTLDAMACAMYAADLELEV